MFFNRVVEKKINLQNGLCTYNDLQYLFENIAYLRLSVKHFNYLLKILTTCFVTMSYLLYTSCIAYVLVVNMKHMFNNSQNNNNLMKINENLNEKLFVKPVNNTNSNGVFMFVEDEQLNPTLKFEDNSFKENLTITSISSSFINKNDSTFKIYKFEINNNPSCGLLNRRFDTLDKSSSQLIYV